MFGWLFDRSLESAANATKRVRIAGVRFRIKKINPINFLDGSKVMRQVFDTYKAAGPLGVDESSHKKIKEHYTDVILSGVGAPKIARKKDEAGFYVEDLFNDWELVEGLYLAIMEFTYGKKKMRAALKQSALQKKN